MWNYRVIRSVHPDGVATYAIHEVYYAEDGTPEFVMEEPASDVTESIDELMDDLRRMQEAGTRPFIDYTYFEELGEKREKK